jgi:hypothetical protein
LNPNLTGVRRFSLQSRLEKTNGPPPEEAALILLVEDNPADATLVRKALEEHGVEAELLVIADGERP